jgi:hypothetical protein
MTDGAKVNIRIDEAEEGIARILDGIIDCDLIAVITGANQKIFGTICT